MRCFRKVDLVAGLVTLFFFLLMTKIHVKDSEINRYFYQVILILL